MINCESTEFVYFFEGCQEIYLNYCKRMGYEKFLDKFSWNDGRKYIKIIRGRSVHCFVDKTNGDVLMAASYKSPAKHPRGNLFDESNGLKYMGEYGPAYLR